MTSFFENPFVEGKLQFDFPDGPGATRYDQWDTHVNVFAAKDEKKAVDFLYVDGQNNLLYLTEIKDFDRIDKKGRYKNGKYSLELRDDVALKFHDTLEGIATPSRLTHRAEQTFSRAVKSLARRAVFHWEIKPSVRADVRKSMLVTMETALKARLHKLKSIVHVRVMNIKDTKPSQRPWAVKRIRKRV